MSPSSFFLFQSFHILPLKVFGGIFSTSNLGLACLRFCMCIFSLSLLSLCSYVFTLSLKDRSFFQYVLYCNCHSQTHHDYHCKNQNFIIVTFNFFIFNSINVRAYFESQPALANVQKPFFIILSVISFIISFLFYQYYVIIFLLFL